MSNNRRLDIKLQMEKDPDSGNILLDICFNKNAPNISFTDEAIFWNPTSEEMNFVNEIFTLMKQSSKSRLTNKTWSHTPDQDHHSKEEKNSSSSNTETEDTSKEDSEQAKEKESSDKEKEDFAVQTDGGATADQLFSETVQ